MIRSHGTKSNALFFFNSIGAANLLGKKKSRSDRSRIHEGKMRLILRSDAVVLFQFFRVTRIAQKNICFSEWSSDGFNWEFGSWIELPMPDRVAYGIAFTTREDNEQLFYCKASEVTLESAPSFAFRNSSSSFYEPGKPIQVTLEIIPSKETLETITITESAPQNWIVTDISNGGIKKGNQIAWTLPASPSPKCVSYTIIPATDSTGFVTFSGKINNLQVMGTDTIDKILTEIRKPIETQLAYLENIGWAQSSGSESSYNQPNPVTFSSITVCIQRLIA